MLCEEFVSHSNPARRRWLMMGFIPCRDSCARGIETLLESRKDPGGRSKPGVAV